MPKRLFLRVGDLVYHRDCRAWGVGRVVEVRTSTLEGGPSLVRIRFQDGQERTFFNDLSEPNCCYYRGIRFYRG
ncbi:MAG: DUF3553 domain-containing protein [Deltaproteobacteria bacterium]|nr:DUF3553 domain-containing protein [Deltaproteobacteria bacterium]